MTATRRLTAVAAALGLETTGVDLACRALRTAEAKARERGHKARFFRHDARQLAGLAEQFETVLDCGLFHVFDDADRMGVRRRPDGGPALPALG